MKRIGERLTFLAMLVMILVGLCSCNADLNRLLFGYVAEVRDSSGIHEFDSIQEGIDYIVQRNGASRDVESRASGDSEAIREEDTVYLVRDVGEGEYGEFFKGKSITVNNYGGVIGIDFQDHVYRFENDTEGGMFFNILDGSEVHIRGGHTIILASNPSPEYAMIVQSPNVKLTDHWLEDRRVHGNIEGSTEYNYANGVQIGANGKLVIDGEKTRLGTLDSTLGTAFDLAKTAKLEIENCELIKIYQLDDTYRISEDPENKERTVDGFKIAGGNIQHPHILDGKIGKAVQAVPGRSRAKTDIYVHVPSDFVYIPDSSCTDDEKFPRTDIRSGETVTVWNRVVCYCNTCERERATVSMGLENPPEGNIYIWGGVRLEPCRLNFSTGWKGISKTNSEIQYKNNSYNENEDVTWGVGYVIFENAASGSVYCGQKFGIRAGSGYGGIDVVLPEDAQLDDAKPEGELVFENGILRFNNPTGSVVRQWKWIVDNDRYSYGAAEVVNTSGASGQTAEYATGATPAQINISQLESAGKIESGKSHQVVLYVKNRKGQTACSMKVYMPEGELTATLFRQKDDGNKVVQDVQKVVFTPVNHADDSAQTAKINKWSWMLDTSEVKDGTDVPARYELKLPSLVAGDNIYAVPLIPSSDWTKMYSGGMNNFALDPDVPYAARTPHTVKLTVWYWDNTASWTYELKTSDGSGEINGYKLKDFSL